MPGTPVPRGGGGGEQRPYGLLGELRGEQERLDGAGRQRLPGVLGGRLARVEYVREPQDVEGDAGPAPAVPAQQADQLRGGEGALGGVPAELGPQDGRQFGRGPAAGVPGGAGQPGQGPPDHAGVAGYEVAVRLAAVAQEQRDGGGGEPLVAAQVLAGRPVEPAQQVEGDVVRCVAQDVRHAPGQPPAAPVFHGRRHRCPPCPRADGRTHTPTRTRAPVHQCA
ncbi:hypothetical protein ACFXGI_32100 [Streptomyces sp. NPDC059355]|uniref:hypothetical protein n=1 Tax=Streptomyces sp. NPDC059355 TaxID=3346811 RepID=UPI003685C9D3